jgi:hypothetical protein
MMLHLQNIINPKKISYLTVVIHYQEQIATIHQARLLLLQEQTDGIQFQNINFIKLEIV